MHSAVAERIVRKGLWLAGIALVLATLVTVAVLYYLKDKRFVVELTEAQLQEKLDVIFPVHKPYLTLLTLTLSEPKVHLVEGRDRVVFGLQATLNVRLGTEEKALGGTGEMSTGIRYEPADYSFYFDDPRLEHLNVQGIPVKYVDIVNVIARTVAQERIRSTRVYTLKPSDLKQSAARVVLKGLEVKDRKLIIVLGL